MITAMFIRLAGPIGPPPTPESRAQTMLIYIVLLVILVVLSSYWTIKYLNPPRGIRNYKRILIFRFLSLITSIFAGLLAVFYNEGQLPYLLFYTLVPLSVSQDVLNLWAKHEINLLNNSGAKRLSKSSRLIITLAVLATIITIGSFTYTAVDRSFTRKRIQNYNECMDELQSVKSNKISTNNPCDHLIRKKWGF